MYINKKKNEETSDSLVTLPFDLKYESYYRRIRLNTKLVSMYLYDPHRDILFKSFLC